MFFILAALTGRAKARGDRRTTAGLAEESSETLMKRYAEGEEAAFAVLLERHQKGVLNFIYRSVGDRDRAEELTQDVFMRVIRTAKRYRPSAKFTTWLFTIARNICIDESRRQAKRRTLSLNETVSSDDDERTFLDRVVDPNAKAGAASLARSRFVERLRLALLELPEEQREVFVLRHYNGLRFREIAEINGVSDNTIKSRMRYALQTLRGLLADMEGMSFDEMERAMVGTSDAPEPV